jgi:hypothetical protein
MGQIKKNVALYCMNYGVFNMINIFIIYLMAEIRIISFVFWFKWESLLSKLIDFYKIANFQAAIVNMQTKNPKPITLLLEVLLWSD